MFNLNNIAKQKAKEVWKHKNILVPQWKNEKAKKNSLVKAGKYVMEPPAMIVACTDGKDYATGYSHEPRKGQYDKTPALKKALCSIPPENLNIGEKNSQCANIIGRCAEPHAALELMKKKKIQPPLGKLTFSMAFRPRTGESFPPCYNCKKTFPNI